MDSDDQLYMHFLEAAVALLAIRCGLNPNTMMANLLQEVCDQGNMGSEATQRIIEQRWNARPVEAATAAARLVQIQTSPDVPKAALSVPEKPELVPMSVRLQEYKRYTSEAVSDSDPPKP